MQDLSNEIDSCCAIFLFYDWFFFLIKFIGLACCIQLDFLSTFDDIFITLICAIVTIDCKMLCIISYLCYSIFILEVFNTLIMAMECFYYMFISVETFWWLFSDAPFAGNLPILSCSYNM